MQREPGEAALPDTSPTHADLADDNRSARRQRRRAQPGRTLLIENDDDYASIILTLLQRDGWQVDWQRSPEEALERLGTTRYDLVLVNTALAGQSSNGSVLSRIRLATSAPVIALTRQDEREEVVQQVLESADYELVTPFSPRRLRAAVRAVSGRGRMSSSSAGLPSEVRIGDITMSLGRLEVRVGERRVELSPREFALLHLMLAHPGAVFTREELARLAWGWRNMGESRAVDNIVRRLRNKIEPDPKHPRYILTERGVGYRFGDQ